MNRLPTTTISIAAAALLLASLAGCAPTVAGPAPGSPASSPAPGKPAGSTEGACRYLSVTDLNSILGRAYTSSHDVPLSDPIPYSYCAFTTADKGQFDLQVSTSDPTEVMSVQNEAAGNHLVPLAGVGDSALSDPTELVVQYGQTVIAAGDDVRDPGMHAITLSQLKAVVAKAHATK